MMRRIGKRNRVVSSRVIASNNIVKIENALNNMVGQPVKKAMDYLARFGFDNTELNGQDGYRKTSGINQYDTWAGYEDESGNYVKLYYTMVRDRNRGGNAFVGEKLRGVYVDGYDVEASTRTRKRSIKASGMRIRASVNSMKDPFEMIEVSRYAFTQEWENNYTGNPNTSWDNIFDNALDAFMRYADDEASGFLLDQFHNGEIDEEEMVDLFDQWVNFSDLNDFDV